MNRTILFCTITLLGAAVCGHASAVEIVKNEFSHGPANCQPALPVFDGNIRKRPKAVANEGTSNAFVTCDFETTRNVANKVLQVGMILVNRNAGSVTISCTLVDGIQDISFSPSIVKSVTIAGGASVRGDIGWSAADNGGANYTFPAVSCNLLPGTEIGGVLRAYLDEVGA